MDEPNTDEAKKIEAGGEGYESFAMVGVKEKGSTWVRVLVGCGIGCGVLVLILGALIGAVYWWFVSPGDQVPTNTIVGEDSVGTIRLDSLEDDEGVQAVLEYLAQGFQDIQRSQSQLPPFLEGFRGSPVPVEDLFEYAPTEATAVFEDVDGDMHFALAVNFPHYIRPLRRLMGFLASSGDAGVEQQTVAGQDAFWIDEEVFLSFIDGTLLLSDDEEVLRRAIERARGDAQVEADVDLQGDLAEMAEAWDAYGSFRDSDGRVAEFLGKVFDRDAAWTERYFGAFDERLERTFIGVDLAGVDRVRAEISTRAVDSTAAGEMVESLQNSLDEAAEALSVEGFTLKHRVTRDGAEVVAEIQVDGFRAKLDAFFDRIR